MAKNPVGWFEIYVTDLARAKQFYEAVLGVQLEKLDAPDDSNMQMLAFPSTMEEYGATGALVKMEGVPSGGNSTLIYFNCDDCSTEESRVKENGGQVQQAKMSIGEYGFCAMATDTEGNMFGLHSQK
jgi:predicted enzyme related to lactoylglutathione lyase